MGHFIGQSDKYFMNKFHKGVLVNTSNESLNFSDHKIAEFLGTPSDSAILSYFETLKMYSNLNFAGYSMQKY